MWSNGLQFPRLPIFSSPISFSTSYLLPTSDHCPQINWEAADLCVQSLLYTQPQMTDSPWQFIEAHTPQPQQFFKVAVKGARRRRVITPPSPETTLEDKEQSGNAWLMASVLIGPYTCIPTSVAQFEPPSFWQFYVRPWAFFAFILSFLLSLLLSLRRGIFVFLPLRRRIHSPCNLFIRSTESWKQKRDTDSRKQASNCLQGRFPFGLPDRFSSSMPRGERGGTVRLENSRPSIRTLEMKFFLDLKAKDVNRSPCSKCSAMGGWGMHFCWNFLFSFHFS